MIFEKGVDLIKLYNDDDVRSARAVVNIGDAVDHIIYKNDSIVAMFNMLIDLRGRVEVLEV